VGHHEVGLAKTAHGHEIAKKNEVRVEPETGAARILAWKEGIQVGKQRKEGEKEDALRN